MAEASIGAVKEFPEGKPYRVDKGPNAARVREQLSKRHHAWLHSTTTKHNICPRTCTHKSHRNSPQGTSVDSLVVALSSSLHSRRPARASVRLLARNGAVGHERLNHQQQKSNEEDGSRRSFQ